MCTRFPTSFTSSTSTSSTSHTLSTSPTSLLHLHQLHLHHIHHPPTSWTQSTGAQRLHLSYKTPTMSFAQEFLHRSSYAGDLWQELLHRCCYTGVATHEFASRWPTLRASELLQNFCSSSSSKFSLLAAGAARPCPSKRDPLRRSWVSDARMCGEMRILLGVSTRPSAEIVRVLCVGRTGVAALCRDRRVQRMNVCGEMRIFWVQRRRLAMSVEHQKLRQNCDVEISDATPSPEMKVKNASGVQKLLSAKTSLWRSFCV